MGLSHSPSLVLPGLTLCLDAGNTKSLLNTVEVLVVAGGGAGGGYGGNDGSGGGGAGGLIYSSAVSITPGTPISVTVGGGGAGVGGATRGNSGGNSVFGELTAIGGGGGGSEGAADQRPGGSGGSGGGGGGYGVATGTGGNGTAGQGNRGGDCTGPGDGGGGGAGSAGESGLTGKGGIGLLSNISGTPTYYAGGGGASGDKRNTRGGGGALGGLGGGGKGQDATNSIAPENGTTNTGGGGGAAAGSNSTYGAGTTLTSGAGGSGIIIVRYPGSQRATGGTVTSVGGHTIHTFTTSGTFTPNFGDLSNNGNTGTLTNGPTYSSANGGSIVFDGVNDMVTKSSATINFSGGTMEVWAYFNNFNGNQGVFSMSTNPTYINFYIPTSRLMRWEVIGNVGNAYSTINSTYVIEPSTWYHFVGTFGEGNTTKLYINGVLNNSQSSYTNVPSNFTSVINLGEYAGYLNGRISNAKIYNRALSAAEISQNFNALKGRFSI